MKILDQINRLLRTDIRDLLKHGRLVDERFLTELKASLASTELPPKCVLQLVDSVERSLSQRVVQCDDVLSAVQTELKSMLSDEWLGDLGRES